MFKILRLIAILRDISPELQTILRTTIDQLAEAAKKTPGKADDEAIAIVKDIAQTVGLY